MEKFYSTKEAANFLGVSVRTFKRLRQKGIVSPDKKGTNNSVFYSETQLMKLPRVVTSSDTSGDTQAVTSGDKIADDTAQVVTQAVPNGSSSDKKDPPSGDKMKIDTTQVVSSSDKKQVVTTSSSVMSPLEKNKAADQTADNSQVESTTIYKNSQQKFNIFEQIVAVRRLDPKTLLNYGVLSLARKDGIICLCGNGSGEDGTGIEPYLNPHNIWTYHCFKCGKTFTNTDYLADYFHLNTNNNFVELIKKSCETFNIPFPKFEKKIKNC